MRFLLHKKYLKSGFSLIEILIIISIIALLATALLISVRSQRQKAEDARTKSEINRFQIAMEDYYGDKNCYPPAAWFDDASDCNTNSMSPYLPSMICDDKTGTPYRYETDATGCKWYILYGTLQRTSDESYNQYFSQSTEFLGTYAAGSANAPIIANRTYDIINHQYYWCSGTTNCTSYNPNTHACTPSFMDDVNCGGGCTQAGSCTPR